MRWAPALNVREKELSPICLLYKQAEREKERERERERDLALSFLSLSLSLPLSRSLSLYYMGTQLSLQGREEERGGHVFWIERETLRFVNKQTRTSLFKSICVGPLTQFNAASWTKVEAASLSRLGQLLLQLAAASSSLFEAVVLFLGSRRSSLSLSVSAAQKQ